VKSQIASNKEWREYYSGHIHFNVKLA